MLAINIKEPWISMILQGTKTIETRNHNRFLNYLGQRVALCRTPGSQIVAYATIRAVYGWKRKESFRMYESMHCIHPGDEYDWKDSDTDKYGYLLEDIEPCTPYKPDVVCECCSHKIINN